MRKRDLKKAAQIYAACVVYYALDSGAYDERLDGEEEEYFIDQVKDVAYKILKQAKLPESALRISTLEKIIDLIK